MSTTKNLAETASPNKRAQKLDGYPLAENGSEPLSVEAQNAYVVMLINSTDHAVTMVRVNKGPWAQIAPIGKTCESTDYAWCVEKKKYVPLLTVACGSDAQVDVAWHENGEWYWTYWDSFRADCRYAGGIIHLVNG